MSDPAYSKYYLQASRTKASPDTHIHPSLGEPQPLAA